MHRITIVVAALVLALLLGIGAQAGTSYSAPTVKSASGDLATHVNSFVAAIPREGSGSYDVPTTSERSTMAAAYDAIETGDLPRAASLADPLGYDVVQYTDTHTGQVLTLLSERRNTDGSWPHAWGMYIFSPTASSDTTVEVPHPVADWNTEDVGVESFRKANAEDLFVAGAHRYANSDGSADVAHAEASVFEDVHKAAIESSTRVFQPHGFSQASHPDCGEVVVSAGKTPPTELAQKTHSALRNAGFDALLYDGVSCPELGATTNVQGVSTRAIGADFLHVESSKPIRDDDARRSLMSSTIADALRSSETQVNLLPADQIGSQAQADLSFLSRTPTKLYHVAESGSDSNDGSQTSPWRTIQKAASTLQPGQAAYVHGGTYYERITTTNPGSSSAPIWLMEAPGENAVIKGTGSSGGPFVRITQPYWIVDGFEIDAGSSLAQAIRFDGTNHAVARNIDAHDGIGNAAIFFDRSEDSALLNSKIHDYTWTEADGSPKDSHGISVYRNSKRILVKNNDSWGHTGDDLQCADEDGVSSADDPIDITIEGNRYGNTHPGGALRERTRENAIDIKTCRNVTVRGNKMFGFRPASTAPGGAALVAHMNADRVLIEKNRFWDDGLAASMGSQQNCCLGSVVFRRNLIFDSTTESGGKGGGIRVGPARRLEAYHNTFYNVPAYAMRLGDDGRVDQAVLINNIVSGAGSAIQVYAPNILNLTSDRNLFWNAPLPSGWQYDQTSVFEDPLFVDDPRNNDYYTKPESPARDVALREPTSVDTSSSTFCGAGPDIGFLESCTSESQTGTLTYAPTHDARVEEANSSTNYGSSSILRTDGGTGSRVDTYLQYSVTDIPAGEKIQSAKLRVWDTDNGTADGPAVYTSSTSWLESTITWSNKPAKSSSGVADKGSIASGSWVEFDVTPLVTGNATYSFVLSQSGTDGANYASKEYSDATKKPHLVVTTGATTGATTSATLVGAGDIATSGSGDEATANLLDTIPGTVFTTGDNAYESGTLDEFNSFYHPSWGRHKARTLPSVGNHEYNIVGSDASGYFDYFGATAGERGKSYYSYNRGDWHIIALNSMCASSVSSCDETAQTTWLKNDLAANPARCTLAYFHHPLFSSGEHGDTQPGGDDSHVVGWVKPLWDALYAANADVIVNGHDHDYERFAPQNPSGTADPARGIREFVVGTGGTSIRSFTSVKPNSEVRNATARGVLKLTLNSTGYDWEFVPVADQTFTDSGSGGCH